ncbi:D-alanyl-D-alanine carboxypeptidase/D-alanyl-D-alanine-endopeptidase [Streptomyces sp. MnatMP-M17]|uniref:D-alanyl-D-alanine carboxypeptidase/D-alanyl-D-alanine endopeptidase n=1 Tax=unclassified Streptomyces TaxID=2593676 RepID=UPI000B8088E2|nr:D-alanyl-D-alanine carboxypeptidase/D-alanyl-D-alanine-endopeptidase [Streptomyces sp. MnatMP-M17]MYZ36834.1 D-alanyl-D-alanine carboxypeptidase/D-alanyl-D-alanine-endopeptidase [Streptomyces sp. SID4917]
MLEPKVWQLTAGSVVAGLALAAVAVAVAGPWDSGQRKAEREWAAAQGRTGGAHHDPRAPRTPSPAPSAPEVLSVLTAQGAEPAELADLSAGLGKTLGPLLDDKALGKLRTASVVDAATGKPLYGKAADTPMTPASTVKIATMAAALSALGPDHRIATTVTATRDAKTLTLVGGGDATLDREGLRSLAEDTTRVLHDRGVTKVTLHYDASLYSGPRAHPIGPNDNIAPVDALMAGQGRLDKSTRGPAPRSGDPAGDAADLFAELLREEGVRTTAAPTAAKPAEPAGSAKPARSAKSTASAEVVAKTYSRPLSALVERALTESDNDVAESLARQTALAMGRPASFAGAEQAVRAQLEKLEVPLTGARFADGSGLDRKDRVSAALLTALLARAADPDHPELRPVLTGLPVARFSGTLRNRYQDAAPAAGLIRAKTGTLTGVNTLAGTAVDSRGRLLAFAFMAGSTSSPGEAQAVLDRLSASLVR